MIRTENPTDENFKLGEKYLTDLKKYSEDEQHWDETLADLFRDAYDDDDEHAKSMNRLAGKYFRSTPESQKLIDDVLIYVCGWSLHTLIGRVGQLNELYIEQIDKEHDKENDLEELRT